VTYKPSEAKTEVCLFKQKSRLARIRAAKIRGTNVYMRYKQNGILINSLEEVTRPSSGLGADWLGPRWHLHAALLGGGHATTHGRGGLGVEGWGWGPSHAVTQRLLSFQCFSVIILSLTSHLWASALTCFLNTLSLSLSLSNHTAGGPGGHTCLLVEHSHYRHTDSWPSSACLSNRVWRGRRKPKAYCYGCCLLGLHLL